jgi:transcriptional regulator with GAF, ATPase, and Fis domain
VRDSTSSRLVPDVLVDGEAQIVCASAGMREALVLARRVAGGDAKVLITGESGVGKDLIARHIHACSPRARHPFVAVNCAALTDTLLESELFGHARGSFTGAHRDKTGKLELADRGTIFLDEVGEMSVRMQAVLLRFLENGEIQPVGAEGPVKRVDARVIAATNRNLTELVGRGVFREDLLYRIQVAHILVPPLRERPEDIRALVRQTVARTGRDVAFSDEAWALLEAYRWPGNVRELQNVIEQLVWMSGVDRIDVHHLPPELQPTPQAVRVRERRRQLSDDLYDGLVGGNLTFWGEIYAMFLNRDITRQDLRTLVSRGLSATCGNYRALLTLFRMDADGYKRLLNFLAAHDCGVDARTYRKGTPGGGEFPTSRPRVAIATLKEETRAGRRALRS